MVKDLRMAVDFSRNPVPSVSLFTYISEPRILKPWKHDGYDVQYNNLKNLRIPAELD